ncbi:hypothetical protein [Salmonella sp. SJTUF15596]|uniref:hypothetical protein n=1 Tax=Salmonella sp. SJTUF15596 TaxID=3229572 RepID=UPI00372C6B45
MSYIFYLLTSTSFSSWHLLLHQTAQRIGLWQNALKRFASDSPLKIMICLA